jgi:hypothetical protein
VAARSGWSNGFVDFDNDGWKDLFTANSHVNDAIDRFESNTYRLPNSVFRTGATGPSPTPRPSPASAPVLRGPIGAPASPTSTVTGGWTRS